MATLLVAVAVASFDVVWSVQPQPPVGKKHTNAQVLEQHYSVELGARDEKICTQTQTTVRPLEKSKILRRPCTQQDKAIQTTSALCSHSTRKQPATGSM